MPVFGPPAPEVMIENNFSKILHMLAIQSKYTVPLTFGILFFEFVLGDDRGDAAQRGSLVEDAPPSKSRRV